MKSETTYPFAILARRKLWFSLSLLVILAGLVKVGLNNQATGQGLAFGIDFTGGAAYIFKFGEAARAKAGDSNADIAGAVRETIAGVEVNGKAVPNPKIQVFADGEVQVRTPTGSQKDLPVSQVKEAADAEAQALLHALRDKFDEVELAGQDLVGPVIGEHLRKIALWALFLGCVAITLYIWVRYNIKGMGAGWLFGVCAVVALVHDVLVMIGVYAFTGTEVNSSFVAAILTVIGYSVNDTVIIFDRIRENIGKLDTLQRRNLDAIEATMEASVWQTMTRSVITALTTMFPLITLYLFGGVTIRDFAFALLIGIISGCYSSIFCAASLFIALYRRKMKDVDTGAVAAARPRPTARTRREEPAAKPTAAPKRELPAAPVAEAAAKPETEAGPAQPKRKPASAGGAKRKRRH